MKKYYNKLIFVKLLLSFLFVVLNINSLYSSHLDGELNIDTLSSEQCFQRANNYFKNVDFDNAVYYYQKAGVLYRASGKWEYYLKTQIQIAETHRINNKNLKAINILLSSEKIVLKHLKNDNRTLLDLYHKLGSIYNSVQNFVNSKYYLKKSIILRIKYYGKNDTALSLSYNSLGNNFYLTSADSALKYYRKALRIGLLKKNNEDSDNAMYYQNIGIIHARKGDFDSAKFYLNKSLFINNKILPKTDHRLAEIFLNVARLNYLLEDFESALEANNRAEDIYIKKFGKNYSSLGTIYLNKGNIYNDLIDYEKALEYYKNALSIYQVQDNPDYSSIAKVYNNLGSVYTQMKEFYKALNYYKKTLSIKRSIDSKIITYRNIAKTNIRIGDYEMADYFYSLAVDSAKHYLGDKHFESGHNYRDYAEFCMKIGKWEKGEKLLLNALNIYSNIYHNKNVNNARVLALLGDYYCHAGDYEKANIYYHRSILSNVNDFSNNDYLSNPTLNNAIQEYELLYSLYRKANALQLMYSNGKKDVKYLIASVQTYNLSIALIDKIKSNLSEESNFLLTENIQDIFYHSIKTSHLAFEITKNPVFLETTFKFIEKNKAAILLSSIRSEDAIKYAGISEDSQRLEKILKKRISAYKKQIFDQKNLPKPDVGKINLWNSKLLYLHETYDSLIARFEIENPEYYSLKYDTSVINISDIKKRIGENKALIQYAVFDNEMYSSVITSNSVLIVSKPIDSIFFQQIEKLYKMFSVDMGNHNIDDYVDFISCSNSLYRMLFDQFESIIKDKDLIIIPDGRLGYLPFETLITKIPEINDIDYRSLPYLLKKHSISYSYSSTLLFKDNLDSDIDNLKLLAFAPSYTNRKDIENNNFIKNHNLSDYIIPLKQAKEEINNISKIYTSTKCEDSDASEERFLNLAPDYDILHLAMHTILNDTVPMYSKLVFTPNKDNKQDMFLNTYEVYNLNLKARMVVLSACNTGSGKLQKGEGIMSLARGFLYCGVPSIVMTLWEVNDRSGAGIMTEFYKNLKDGLSKDKALQKAKLHYIKNAKQYLSHPYFWSQYVCIGDVKPISNKSINSYRIILLTGILFAVIIIFLIIRRKKNLKES